MTVRAPEPLISAGRLADRAVGMFHDADRDVGMSWIEPRLSQILGCSALIDVSDQLDAAFALLELDGLARRLTIAPPEWQARDIAGAMEDAEIDCVITDRPERHKRAGVTVLAPSRPNQPSRPKPNAATARLFDTEWVLPTSGTTGRPKLALHTLTSLANAIRSEPASAAPKVWATFYDIRRYGGLQILLRAIIGGCDFVFSRAGEALPLHLSRLGSAGVTSISGTPSHWRRVLMCADRGLIAPAYIRLSGEIADQAVLDALLEAYPDAAIGHAYASTEAGVGFAIDDGLAGFPTSIVDLPSDGLEFRVVDHSLRIRSPRGAAARYLGKSAPALKDALGFIDTGDLVEARGGRFHFIGRRGGIVNVGGLKVHPEEVEAVVNSHPKVRHSRARSRGNPFTGSIVAADIVLREPENAGDQLRRELTDFCLARLERHKAPAIFEFVDDIQLTPSGKVSRVT